MEEASPYFQHKHVGLYYDNSAAVSWVKRMVNRSSQVAGPLLVALTIRLKARQALSLTPLHISGVENGIGDIPSRLFGGTPKWHYKTDEEFLTLFNSKYPLPNQNSWALYCIPNSTYVRVISVLWM